MSKRLSIYVKVANKGKSELKNGSQLETVYYNPMRLVV